MARDKINGVPVGAVDRQKISDASLTELENAVNNINDKPTRKAVSKIVEILTGKDVTTQ